MKSTNTIAAARVGLLLSELRLPTSPQDFRRLRLNAVPIVRKAQVMALLGTPCQPSAAASLGRG